MRKFSIIIGLLSGLLFGCATPLSKILLSQMNGFELAGFLYIGAALTFLPYFIKHSKNEINALKKTKKKINIIGIILFGGLIGPLLLMIGLKTSSSMSVSIWLNMELVATAILGVLIFKDNLEIKGWIGVVFTLGAGILVSLQETNSGLFSGLFVIGACICWAIDNHLTAIVDEVSPQTVTMIKGTFGGITNLIIGLVLSNGNISFHLIPFALLIGVFSYGLSIVLYVISAQNLGATRSQILFSTGPFWGIITAAIFLSEPFHFLVVISMVLLAIGIYLTSTASHSHEHLHTKIVHNHLHSHNDGHHTHIHNDVN